MLQTVLNTALGLVFALFCGFLAYVTVRDVDKPKGYERKNNKIKK